MSRNSSFNAGRFAQQLREGNLLTLGRALTLVENGGEHGDALLNAISGDYGAARIVGFTGPPGAGKSTLVDALIHEWRKAGHPVAVLAVDPVSPVSGGAVLGDRTRMGAHSLDDGVFIRSVSARGHLGGLSAAVYDMANVMDAAGWPLILIETVGAGQSETEIAQVADLCVVISAPGLGDELQAIKAGILEIGDVLVVNKADRKGADQTAKHLKDMLSLRAQASRNIPVLNVSATTGLGVTELKNSIDDRLAASGGDGKHKRYAHKKAVSLQQWASRLAAGIADEDLAALDPDELSRFIQRSIRTIHTQNKE